VLFSTKVMFLEGVFLELLGTTKFLSYVNLHPYQIIRSIFYNKFNDSILTVSVDHSDDFTSLKCRTTSINLIKQNRAKEGYDIFCSESLSWPGFVEFDDVNGVILTHSATNGSYKIWDMENYELLFTIVDDRNPGISDIKISPGTLLLIYRRTFNSAGHVKFQVINVRSGELLDEWTQLLHRNKALKFVEQMDEFVLLKQEDENLLIYNVLSGVLVQRLIFFSVDP